MLDLGVKSYPNMGHLNPILYSASHGFSIPYTLSLFRLYN